MEGSRKADCVSPAPYRRSAPGGRPECDSRPVRARAMISQHFEVALAVTVGLAIERGPRDAELAQRALGRQM
jgi:hypothetical protein